MSSATSSNQNDSTTNQPPLKRIKTAAETTPDDEILNPQIFSQEANMIQRYRDAKPYRHGIMENVFKVDFLNLVKRQIKDHSKVTFKETDLFRVYQSIDMANLTPTSKLAKDMPSIMKLRNVLYSDEWRAFMERLSQLPPGTLSEQVDCAVNCHAPGCHLLCHDDVIGTRKISYILYLTEPDWKPEEGGALELYDSVVAEEDDASPKEPAVSPSNCVLPIFNTMAYFEVKPGVSFHSVQEVLGERPRLSLQGWFHAAEAPEHMELATLSRLKQHSSDEPVDDSKNDNSQSTTSQDEDSKNPPPDDALTTAVVAAAAATDNKLSDADRDYLAMYINPTYLTKTSMEDIRQRFEEESSVQLKHFLRKEWITKINEARQKQDTNQPSVTDSNYYHWGVGEGWKLVGPPHKQRYLAYEKVPEAAAAAAAAVISTGDQLHDLKKDVLQSEPFGRYLNYLTSLGVPIGCRGMVRRFRPGLDYTVAHYGVLTKESVLDATMCFVAGTGVEQNDQVEEVNEADVLWQSDDCGGFECYIEADDDDDESDNDGEKATKKTAADEYNEEDDTALLSVSASNNTLSLVYRDPGTMRFIKFLGSRAPSSRWDISMEYEVENTEGDEEANEEPSQDEEHNGA